jgi:hypothetical protein
MYYAEIVPISVAAMKATAISTAAHTSILYVSHTHDATVTTMSSAVTSVLDARPEHRGWGSRGPAADAAGATGAARTGSTPPPVARRENIASIRRKPSYTVVIPEKR